MDAINNSNKTEVSIKNTSSLSGVIHEGMNDEIHEFRSTSFFWVINRSLWKVVGSDHFTKHNYISLSCNHQNAFFVVIFYFVANFICLYINFKFPFRTLLLKQPDWRYQLLIYIFFNSAFIVKIESMHKTMR